MDAFYQALKSVSGGTVLDVATGRGDFIGCIAEFQNVTSVVALDINPEPADFAQRFAPLCVTYTQGNAEALPFADASFDTVCISNSLHHMTEMKPVINEMVRVLKKNGTMVINEMYSDTDDEQRRTHVLLHHWWGAIDSLTGIPHNTTLTKAEVTAFVQSCDLGDFQLVEYAFPKQEMNDDIRNQLLKSCDMYFEKIRKNSLHNDLIAQGEILKERICDVGFASAPALLCLITKG